MSTPEPEAGPESLVAVAYVHSDHLSACWHHSIIEMLAYDAAHHGRIGGWIPIHCGTDGLVEARNLAVRQFLEEKRCDWLWWVDTDMGFAPNTIDVLFESAHPMERPMVGALCFSMREMGQDGKGGWNLLPTPTIFDWGNVTYNPPNGGPSEEQVGFIVRYDYRRGELQRCAGTGSACVLIHRSVFEKVEGGKGGWYQRVPNITTGQLISEDLSFCLRAGALNIPIHVHAGLEATHHKEIWVSEEHYVRDRTLDALAKEANGHVAKVAEDKLASYGLK